MVAELHPALGAKAAAVEHIEAEARTAVAERTAEHTVAVVHTAAVDHIVVVAGHIVAQGMLVPEQVRGHKRLELVQQLLQSAARYCGQAYLPQTYQIRDSLFQPSGCSCPRLFSGRGT